VSLLTIGEFSRRTRLSPKALRLYDQLGLLQPARVDAGNGYRLYGEDQIERARLVALCRRLDMPLSTIAAIVELDRDEFVEAVSRYWDGIESTLSARRRVVLHLLSHPTGEDKPMYEIQRRHVGERSLLSVQRHVHADAAGAFFGETLQRLRNVAPGLVGIRGVPFIVYYGEVSADSDGPVEICRPVEAGQGADVVRRMPEIQLRAELAHDEAYIRLTLAEVTWPELAPAVDALERWVADNDLRPVGPPRQLLIADWRTATPETPACDLAITVAEPER
jgi:DNA-binding transcriptional MerR regulator